MPDDLRIPVMNQPGQRTPVAPSYRARSGESGPPWALIVAAGLGGLLLVGGGGWALMNRRPAVVPVIEADARPIRVKPENPGGMQVAGADEVLGDNSTGTERMAPAAEAPAPQALRAQMTPPAAPAAVTPRPETSPPAAAAPAAAPAPGASPLPDTPTRASTKPAAATPAPRSTGGPAGGPALVQLGALPSEAAAMAEWKRLARVAPDAVEGRQPTVQKVERDGKTFWRLRTGGFADVADATAYCTKIRGKGGTCAIASF